MSKAGLALVWATIGFGFFALTILTLMFAPILYAEAHIDLSQVNIHLYPHQSAAFGARPGAAAGTAVDAHWRVQRLSRDTYAIGEPQDHPNNYEYLLIGQNRALLIDAGAGERSIRPVIAGLTRLPVTVIPTHLHDDHINGLRNFSDIAMIDLPQTRARVRDGVFRASRYQYRGPSDQNPRFRVTRWIAPGGQIDLGGRRVSVLWTPGHTATSLSVYDPRDGLLFTGDFLVPGSIWAFISDSSLSAYESAADRLLATLPPKTLMYAGHCCRNDAPPEAPWLAMDDLRDARRALGDIQSGRSRGSGLLLRRYPVNRRMTLVTFYPFGNR